MTPADYARALHQAECPHSDCWSSAGVDYRLPARDCEQCIQAAMEKLLDDRIAGLARQGNDLVQAWEEQREWWARRFMALESRVTRLEPKA